MTRAFRRIEERLPSHRRNVPFICNQYYSLPSPFGEGAGVKLLFPSLGGVGEVLTLVFSITANVKKKIKKVWSVH